MKKSLQKNRRPSVKKQKQSPSLVQSNKNSSLNNPFVKRVVEISSIALFLLKNYAMKTKSFTKDTISKVAENTAFKQLEPYGINKGSLVCSNVWYLSFSTRCGRVSVKKNTPFLIANFLIFTKKDVNTNLPDVQMYFNILYQKKTYSIDAFELIQQVKQNNLKKLS